MWYVTNRRYELQAYGQIALTFEKHSVYMRICIHRIHAPYACITFMYHLFVSCACTTCTYPMYVRYVCIVGVHHMYVFIQASCVAHIIYHIPDIIYTACIACTHTPYTIVHSQWYIICFSWWSMYICRLNTCESCHAVSLKSNWC